MTRRTHQENAARVAADLQRVDKLARLVLDSSLRELLRESATGRIEVESNGVRVGHVSVDGKPDSETLKLAKVLTYRHLERRGFGSQALKQLADLARADGFKRIVGEITQGDLELQPWLPGWYEAIGFTVTKNGNGRDLRMDL